MNKLSLSKGFIFFELFAPVGLTRLDEAMKQPEVLAA
jgi:hypothetical protein